MKIQHYLVEGRYIQAVAACSSSRLDPETIRRVIENNGQTLAMPPEDTTKNIEFITEIADAPIPTWAVYVHLWASDDRSDLTLEVTASCTRDGCLIELDDLHVL